MTANQRETFRIEPEDFDATLRWQGREARCVVENLSAGGARVTSTLPVPQAAECELVLRPADAIGAGTPQEAHAMKVLEAGPGWLRLRTVRPDALSNLVFEAQRLARARQTGAGEASPMASDGGRRRALRTEQRQRFSKGSLRPDADS
jgi:hypothetical protein